MFDDQRLWPEKILQPFTNPWPGRTVSPGCVWTSLVVTLSWNILGASKKVIPIDPLPNLDFHGIFLWFFRFFVCWGWFFCCRFKTCFFFWSHTNWSLECISAGHLAMSLKKPWLRSTWPLTHLITAWDIQANECRGSSNAILEQIGSLLWFLLSTHRSVKEWISWKM